MTHNKKFKADKPVKPVCGLTHCYVDARTGARGLISMKKSIILLLLVLIYFPCFSQVINEYHFPEDNDIDKQYEIENQKWTSNYEWQMVLKKYKETWKTQMYMEMERLISIIPESENEIRENQKKWEESLELSYKLVADNVDLNKVGREDYIGSFSNGELIQFRERAKYYLCLYYTIKDQRSKDIWYTDIHKTELAK